MEVRSDDRYLYSTSYNLAPLRISPENGCVIKKESLIPGGDDRMIENLSLVYVYHQEGMRCSWSLPLRKHSSVPRSLNRLRLHSAISSVQRAELRWKLRITLGYLLFHYSVKGDQSQCGRSDQALSQVLSKHPVLQTRRADVSNWTSRVTSTGGRTLLELYA